MEKSNVQNDLAQSLALHPLFQDLPESTLKEIVKSSKVRHFSKGSIIFFQNDPAEGYYLVLSGGVMILLTTEDGRELIISEMRPGDTFGELALITGKNRSTTAVTHEPTELLVVPTSAFLHALENEPALVRRMLDLLARLMYISNEREGALAFLDAPGRLARILRILDDQSATQGYVTISQEELARRTGLTRQTVAKILGRWRRLGWLLTGRGRIVLLNRSALSNIEQQSGA